MAVVKPKELMINYEGAWKELRNRCGNNIIISDKDLLRPLLEGDVDLNAIMKELEKQHKNMITIKRRSNPEIVDYCIKKNIETQMQNIHLKRKLKEYQKGTKTEHWIQVKPKKKPERKLYIIHLVCLTNDDLKFVFDWEVTEKKREYLDKAFRGNEEISWHGLKMRIKEMGVSLLKGEELRNVKGIIKV